MTDPAAQPDVRLELFSEPRFLSGARAMVHNIAERQGFDDIRCGQISLAVDEALCNIIKHGYDRRKDGRIWISVWAPVSEARHIKVVIEDEAQQVDESAIQSRDLNDIRPGGLGVHIMREVMDDVQFEKREGGGMRLTMVKRLCSAPTDSTDERQPSSAVESETEHE